MLHLNHVEKTSSNKHDKYQMLTNLIRVLLLTYSILFNVTRLNLQSVDILVFVTTQNLYTLFSQNKRDFLLMLMMKFKEALDTV